MATAEYCVKPDGAHGPTSALGAQRAPSLCSRWATDLSFVPPTSAIEVDLGKAKPLAMNLGMQFAAAKGGSASGAQEGQMKSGLRLAQ